MQSKLAVWHALLAFCAAAPYREPRPSVLTTRGRVEGLLTQNSEAFLGVPFAEPPLGDARFLPARLKQPWKPKTLEARGFAKACWQGDDNATLYSEDCLMLNIWRPLNTESTDRLPVLVYIHGGAFSGGGIWVQDSVQLGDVFAARQQVIFVTIAYRLGPLGFLALEELRPVSAGGNGGMNGVYDQIIALRFLQEELSYFGGDPSKVTVVGESAGGQSVTGLLVSPEARGLFRAVVIESGAAAFSPLWRFGNHSEGITRGQLFMSSRKCSDLECLRQLPASDMYWHAKGSVPKVVHEWFRDYLWTDAWVDGRVLPMNKTVSELLQDSSNLNAQRIMLGANSADGVTIYAPFDWLPPFWSNSSLLYTSSMSMWWKTFYHLHAPHVQQVYPLRNYGGNALVAFVEADGDYTVTCPTLALANATYALGVPTYLYMFAHNTQADTSYWSGWKVPPSFASHGAELPFVFGRPGDGVSFENEDWLLANATQDYWGAFVREGDPNAGKHAPWPQFQGHRGLHMRLQGSGPQPADDYRFELCNFWKQYMMLSELETAAGLVEVTV
mmetsp:Transcript_66595/g.124276  ORF Transcript_66595/g.124276 Transcript_66595/m.124276 type:complete len:557 (+) Transcript_66595:39-1709(+)